MRIALLGYGTVGRGVDEICATLPTIEVCKILELPQFVGKDPRMTASFDEIVDDPSIEVVVECMGGLRPAFEYISQALAAKKHVVTSNKAVVAAHFSEFAKLAQASGVGFFIEATTGGGIPWIASLEKIARVEQPQKFWGILNGTSNYIIDRMTQEDLDFADALKQAQEFGYAEADPSADIDGIDVANKTIISAGVAFGVECVKDFCVIGIRNLTKTDLEFFTKQGLAVRLLGQGVATERSYAVCVTPCLVSNNSLEAHVPSNFNLASAYAESIGELKFYGQGAGSLPTGNAMVQDILDCMDGKYPRYSLSSKRQFDPALLTHDYVLRASGFSCEGALELGGSYLQIDSLSAQEAAELYQEALASDPTSFIAQLSDKNLLST